IREPSLSEAPFELCEVLGPAEWGDFPDIADAKLWIDLAHAANGYPRILHPSKQRLACRANAQRRFAIWTFPQCVFGPYERLIATTGEEVGPGGPILHVEYERIAGTEAHDLCKVWDGCLW